MTTATEDVVPLRRRRCPSLKDLCVVQIAERVCDVRNATDLASFAAHLDAPSLRAYALRVAAANLDAALCEVGPEALVECDAFTTSALERCLKGRRGDGWSTFTGNRDAARGADDDDADDADADDRYDGYDRYDDDDDERVFRERRDAAEFLARIRAASASDDRADDCEPIESAATNKPTGVNKPRRGGRGRASNDDASPAAPTTAPRRFHRPNRRTKRRRVGTELALRARPRNRENADASGGPAAQTRDKPGRGDEQAVRGGRGEPGGARRAVALPLGRARGGPTPRRGRVKRRRGGG